MFMTLQWYMAQFQGLSSVKGHTVRRMRQMQTSLPSYSLFNSPWLSESALLVGNLIKEMASVNKEGEKHPLPILFSNIVLNYVYGISETQQAYFHDSWALEIPTKFRLCFESLWKQRLSICCRLHLFILGSLVKQIFILLLHANVTDRLQSRQVAGLLDVDDLLPDSLQKCLSPWFCRQNSVFVPWFDLLGHRRQVPLHNLAIMIFILLCKVLQGHI